MSGVDSKSIVGNFVGRERELAELVSACEAGADSEAHLFLISGEPGIGKTRLADELASRVKARGMQVLWGRCWEGDGAPAYWPWIQVIRSFLGALEPERRNILARESEIASEIIHRVAQIIPDLQPALSTSRPSGREQLAPSEARFRLFDAVTNFLKIGRRAHTMLIVIDDLHDADEASLELLRFFARESKGAAIKIVATYRDLEVRRSPELSKQIGELTREARSIPLAGFSEGEVAQLIGLSAGKTADDALVAKLCAATNGNPLFVDGIVRNLIAERAIGSAASLDHLFKIPSGVREAIRGRLDRLSAESNSILAVAAAIGNEFAFNLCQNVAEVSPQQARRLLDEASGAGIVTSLGRGRYRFSHALVRSAVYDELDANRRVLNHDRIANRLEEIYREDIDPHLAELAHHFREAGVTEKAIEYSVRAGRFGFSVFAFTDAAEHLQAALKLMEQQGSDARRRADLLAALGRIVFEINREKAVEYDESAVALYESIGCFDKAAKIHIRLGTIFSTHGQPTVNIARAKEHFRQAESVLAKGPETISLAWLYKGIAVNASLGMDLVGCASAARRAMEISDRLNDKNVWANAAAAYAQCLVLSGQLRKGFELFSRAFEATVKTNSSGLSAVWPAGWYAFCLGDLRGAREWCSSELSRPRNASSPVSHQILSSLLDMISFRQGHLEEARRRLGSEHWGIRFWLGGEWEVVADLQETAAQAAERIGDQVARLNLSIALGLDYLILGEYSRAEAHLLYGLDNGERGPLVFQEMRARPLLVRVYLAMDRLDEAAEQVARCHHIMAAGEDWGGLAGDVLCAEAFVAAARCHYDRADRQFESAQAIHQKYHLTWEEAGTLHCWGLALAAAGDNTRAAEKFDAAIANHRSRGMGPRFLDWLTADKMRALGSQPTRTDVGGTRRSLQPESETVAFRREGEFWTITYRGATFRLKDAKGLHYLAYLLARPGKRIHVLDLIEAVEGCVANRRTTMHAESEDLKIVREIGDAGPTIDARSRAEYRTRLRDLQADLDEAERMNDLGRCERLRTEIEMVGQELTGSSGLGGRARTVSGSAERARKLVGKNIRSMVEKIRQQDPALGRNFAATISTGYFCEFQPDPDQPISWQF